MPTPAQLTAAGFEKKIDRPGMVFEIWKRNRDGRVLAYKASNGNVFGVNAQGFSAEPIAMLLILELADIIRELGSATLGPAGLTQLTNRLMAAMPIIQINNPSVLGI